MHIYRKIYEFAASAGAYEGYVYKRSPSEMDMDALTDWTENLTVAYRSLSPEVLEQMQNGCNATLGRAIHSLVGVLGEDHPFVNSLKTMVTAKLPESADDFAKEKWHDG